ncbi:MAG TPA: TlpA disulfide reductase family protein [Planctomycetota bacterium]|nr:TlpA disulfide reductase family protein [Planctomycetota bacterium]
MRSLSRFLTVLFFVCVSSMAMTINDLVPGQAASGQNLAPSDLKGKVVFVAYWGIDCPHCIAEIPLWDALYKKFHAEGFEIIALERHHTSESAISALARSNGLDFTLTAGGSLKGAVVTRIPHGFLFGVDGNLVQENPYELESRVAALVKETVAAKAAATPAPQPKQEIASSASPEEVAFNAMDKVDAAAPPRRVAEKKTPTPVAVLAKCKKMCGEFCCEENANDPAALFELAASRLDLEAETMREKSKQDANSVTLADSLLEFEATAIKEKLTANSPKFSAERFEREAEALREKLKLDSSGSKNDFTADAILGGRSSYSADKAQDSAGQQ